MKARMLAAAVLLGAATASFACNKDKPSPSPEAPAASATPVTAASLPARADEEQKASQEITAENFKAQLVEIEKEILDEP